MAEDIFIDLSKYCFVTGRSYSSALRDVRKGRIPFVRIGRSILIPVEGLRLMAESASTTQTEKSDT